MYICIDLDACRSMIYVYIYIYIHMQYNMYTCKDKSRGQEVSPFAYAHLVGSGCER